MTKLKEVCTEQVKGLQEVRVCAATHCNTLQHTATHCNTRQHTETHCNTLQHIGVRRAGEGSAKGMYMYYAHTKKNSYTHKCIYTYAYMYEYKSIYVCMHV